MAEFYKLADLANGTVPAFQMAQLDMRLNGGCPPSVPQLDGCPELAFVYYRALHKGDPVAVPKLGEPPLAHQPVDEARRRLLEMVLGFSANAQSQVPEWLGLGLGLGLAAGEEPGAAAPY